MNAISSTRLSIVLLLLFLISALAVPTAAVAEQEHPAASSEQVEHAEKGGAIANPLFWDPDLALFTLFVFLGLLGVLWKFAWGPIVKALEAREQTVVDHIAAAEEKHEEAKGLLAAHEARLATAKDEVREMLEEARRDAEATKGQIVAEADAAARAHRDRAVRDIEQARGTAVRELAEQAANASVELAGQVVQQNLSKEQQADLVRDAITKLTNSSPSQN